MITRLKPKDRKAQILDAALTVAKRTGFNCMKREDVAIYADVSAGLVTKYFSSVPKLKKAVMKEAIKQKELKVIAEGIATMDKEALSAPSELKRIALKSIL